MTAGDPKKAIVLGVVALAILGVAVVRIIPKGDSGPPAAAASHDGVAAVEAVKDRFDHELRRNPFYHPGLDIVVRAEGESLAPPEPMEGIPPVRVPPVNGGGLQGDIGVRATGAGPEAPAENTGNGQQEKQKYKVVVNAVLEVARPLAYIRVGEEEFRVGVGDVLPQIGTVLTIAARGVFVKTATGKVMLPIGESVEI